MSVYSYFVYLVLSILLVDARRNTHYVGNRTTMVHLFEWTWNAVADECERFLGPQGYGGVQVSPINENIILPGRPWYERYQPISYRLITRSGNEREFRSMVKRCNKAGVRIIVDAVFNHMCAPNGKRAKGTGGTIADTEKRSYPTVPYIMKNFHIHPICMIDDYNNATNVRYCELSGLEDLDQSQEHVRKVIVTFLNKAIDAGASGFRVDAAKHMEPRDLGVIYSRLKKLNRRQGLPNDEPYIVQEVIDYGSEAISKYEYNKLGDVTEFTYGSGISAILRGEQPIKNLGSMKDTWKLLPSDDALVFIDNHDTQREKNGPLTYKDGELYRAAVAFMLAYPYGKTRVMSSYSFKSSQDGPPADSKERTLPPTIHSDGSCGNGWVCEHRWRQIRGMVQFRNQVGNQELTNWWDNGSNQIAFCRGNRGFFAFNNEKNTTLQEKLKVCVEEGTYCDVISGELKDGKCTGKSVVVDKDGKADIRIVANDEDKVLAIHQGSRVN